MYTTAIRETSGRASTSETGLRAIPLPQGGSVRVSGGIKLEQGLALRRRHAITQSHRVLIIGDLERVPAGIQQDATNRGHRIIRNVGLGLNIPGGHIGGVEIVRHAEVNGGVIRGAIRAGLGITRQGGWRLHRPRRFAPIFAGYLGFADKCAQNRPIPHGDLGQLYPRIVFNIHLVIRIAVWHETHRICGRIVLGEVKLGGRIALTLWGAKHHPLAL